MRCKEVSLIVDLRNGKNLAQIPDTEEHSEALSIQQRDESAAQQPASFESVQPHLPQDIDLLQQRGHEVTVIGVAANPEKKDTYIIAGTLRNHETDEVTPTAIRVNVSTILVLSMAVSTLRLPRVGETLFVAWSDGRLGEPQPFEAHSETS